MDIAKLRNKTQEVKAALKPKEKTIKPQPGANRYVLLPGWRAGEEETLSHAFGAHYIKDADENTLAYVQCPSATHGDTCEVCNTIAAAIRKAPTDDAIKVLKQSASKRSFVMNVLELDGSEPNTPKMLELSKTTFEAVNSAIDEWAEMLFDPTDPMILTIERTGKGLGTKYTVATSPKRHKLPAGVLKSLPNIDDFVRADSEEEVRKAITAFGTVAGVLTGAAKVLTSPYLSNPDIPKTPSSALLTDESGSRPPAINDELSALLDDDIDLE